MERLPLLAIWDGTWTMSERLQGRERGDRRRNCSGKEKEKIESCSLGCWAVMTDQPREEGLTERDALGLSEPSYKWASSWWWTWKTLIMSPPPTCYVSMGHSSPPTQEPPDPLGLPGAFSPWSLRACCFSVWNIFLSHLTLSSALCPNICLLEVCPFSSLRFRLISERSSLPLWPT